MMRLIGLIALALMLALGTATAGSGSIKDRIEASMLVTGEIDIEPDGTVSGYRPDKPDKLPPYVKEYLSKVVPAWRFKPVEIGGKPAAVSSSASILLKVRNGDDDSVLLEVAKASFGSHEDADIPKSKRLAPPRYPKELAMAGAGGTVYLIVKVARDGTVADVMAEQVNLRVVASESRMKRIREEFARVSIGTARSWTFDPPESPGDAPHWLVRVPVTFVPPGGKDYGYGEWHSYIPGERATIPWVGAEDMDAPDTLVAGGVYGVGKRGPELLTPLGRSEG